MITLLYMGLFRIDTSKHGSRGIKTISYKLTSSEDEQSPRKEILNSLYSNKNIVMNENGENSHLICVS